MGAGFAFETGSQTSQNRVVIIPAGQNVLRTLEGSYQSRTPFDVGAVFVPELRFTRWGTTLAMDAARQRRCFHCDSKISDGRAREAMLHW